MLRPYIRLSVLTIHAHALVDLLPQVRTENLNERDFEGRDLAHHHDAGKIELDLETNVDVGSVDGG